MSGVITPKRYSIYFNAFPPFSPGLGSVQLTSLTTIAVVKHVGFYWEKALLTTQVFEQNVESCPFFDASPGSKCAIRWIPKSVCDLCGSLGWDPWEHPKVLATFAKKKFGGSWESPIYWSTWFLLGLFTLWPSRRFRKCQFVTSWKTCHTLQTFANIIAPYDPAQLQNWIIYRTTHYLKYMLCTEIACIHVHTYV